MTIRAASELLICFLALVSARAGAPPGLTPGGAAIGKHLQAYTTVKLDQPAAADLQLTLTSSDPTRLLLSKTPETAGTPSVTLPVRSGFRESPDFWLHALADSGDVTYTAEAPGYSKGTGKVTLGPSGVVVIGPFGVNSAPEFTTTPGAWPTKITLRTMRLDSSMRYVEPQYVRGGFSVDVAFVLSDAQVGEVTPSYLKIGPAEDTGSVQFKPSRLGRTALTLKPPTALQSPATYDTLVANVRTPGLAVADDMMIGENLQLAAALSLGEPAPPSGVKVKLRSSDPRRLLLSASPTEVGKPSIDITMPAGAVTTTYYLQSLSASGTVTHTAVADGFLTRTGTVMLAPSGVIIMLEKHGPPDEAEVFRPESAGSRRNQFVALLSKPETTLVVYTAYLSPVTRRSADITVQPLRAGLTVQVELKNSNPGVGTAETKPVIRGGDDRGLFSFKPRRPGETVLSVVAPKGFTEPSNATELMAIVRE